MMTLSPGCGRALGGVAAVVAAVVGLTAAGPIELPGVGTFVMRGGHDANSLPNQGDPPVYPRQRMLDDAADLELLVLPVVEDLGLTGYIDEKAAWGRRACRGLTWSHGSFRNRDSGCAKPDDTPAHAPQEERTEMRYGVRLAGARHR